MLLRVCALAWLSLGCLEPGLPPPGGQGDLDAGVAGCSPVTCTGCCAGAACLGGNDRGACGYDGRRCAACAAGTSCMSPGACIADVHDGGAFRADGGAGVVVVDPLTGRPLEPPRRGCVLIFGRLICG